MLRKKLFDKRNLTNLLSNGYMIVPIRTLCPHNRINDKKPHNSRIRDIEMMIIIVLGRDIKLMIIYLSTYLYI